MSDYRTTCAGKLDGSVWCWGNDTQGGYILPGLANVPSPTRVDGTFDQWRVGGHHACGRRVSDARWACYGWNYAGQLGQGTTDALLTFVDLCPP